MSPWCYSDTVFSVALYCHSNLTLTVCVDILFVSHDDTWTDDTSHSSLQWLNLFESWAFTSWLQLFDLRVLTLHLYSDNISISVQPLCMFNVHVCAVAKVSYEVSVDVEGFEGSSIRCVCRSERNVCLSVIDPLTVSFELYSCQVCCILLCICTPVWYTHVCVCPYDSVYEVTYYLSHCYIIAWDRL